MHSQASIPLKILSREDSWNLFVRTARRSFESITFESVARKVAGECKGLPIALIAVARALRDKDEAEWQKAARRLEKSQSATVEDEEDSFHCIKLSYDYLKDEDSKSCFLLGCLFPEDYDIPVQDLLKYAIGTGLFQDETIDDSRGTADSVVKYLKDSCLLMDSKEKGCVKMHDVIRDTALNIAKSKDGHGFLVKAGCGLKHWPLGSYQGYSAISLMRNHIRKLPEEELVCPNLQILLLKQNYLTEIPKKLIQSLDKLRLLDLSNTGFSSLPESCSLLTNLQALYLDFCHNLMKICTVGKLKKLELLSMRKYPGRELSKEIGHLTNLRILDISCASIVTIPSKVISKLHKLQELYMLYCKFEHWGCEVEGQGEETNIGFDELAGLSNLRILQVCILDAKYIPKNVEAAPSWIYFHIRFIRSEGSGVYNQEDQNQEHPNSRTLDLEAATISTLPDWFINVVTKKTEKLEYRRYRGMRDIVMEYDHCKLHELNHLRVCGDFLDSYVYLKELMNTTRRVQKGPVFKNLEEMHLIYLHLEELCVGELPPGSFLNLKVLNIHCCVMLKTVSKFVQRLPNLEKLYLKWMEQLEYAFGCEGFEPKQSNLREVNLLDLDALRSICNGPVPHEMFQNLKSLKIHCCELLQSLFTSDVAECLVQSEDLSVERCRLLESVIEGVNNEKTVLPNLKNLVLINLPKLYGASSAADIECPSLEHLTVEECPQFQFSSSTSSSLFEASWNQLLFSKCAYEYFGCRNPFNLNDSQLCNIIYDDSQLCDIVYDC